MAKRPASLLRIDMRKYLANFIAVFMISGILFSAIQPNGTAFASQAAGTSDQPRQALSASNADVTLNVPAEVSLGSAFDFTVTFDNTSGSDTGYGPYFDVYLPLSGADGLSALGSNDGIHFVSASYISSGMTPIATLDCPEGTTLTHPLTHQTVTCPSQTGLYDPFTWQLVVFQLPFGSFTPTQTPADVTIHVQMSDQADLNTALPIMARGGYLYGDTATGQNGPLENPSLESDSTTPYILRVSKTYHGPEDETATGPNYPRRYTVTADIADGQTITNFSLTDNIPNNMQFLSVISSSPSATCTSTGTSGPGGSITCTYGSVTGSSSASDATFVFEYYIPLLDAASARVINPTSGDDVTSCNHAFGGGDWVPVDTRDATTAVSAPLGAKSGCSPAGEVEHTLWDKSIAVQKSVRNVTKSTNPVGTNNNPGDVLEYTIDGQISDFFAFQNVTVADVISDGQHFDSSFTPTLSVQGNGFTSGEAGFFADGSTSNYSVEQDFTGATETLPIYTLAGTPHDGSSTIHFDVSQELIKRGQTGRLIGGCIPVAGTGGSAPSCSGGVGDGPTTFQIKFRTVILENFVDTFPSGDPSVDQGDVLNDTVTASGDLLTETDTNTPTGQSEADGSAANVEIAYGQLTKTIYAVDGTVCGTQPCSNVILVPKKTVTYRVTYTLPNSDFEKLTFTDFLPLPLLSAADPDGDNTPGGWTFQDEISSAAPAAGVVKFGPTETFRNLAGTTSVVCPASPASVYNGDGIPCLYTNSGSGNNSLIIYYGDYDSTNAPATKIDLLFTVTVNDKPFADGLFHTNQVHVAEGSTNAGDHDGNSIVQIRITEPQLSIRKGIIGTGSDVTGAVYSPASGILPSGVTLNPLPASCPRLSGAVTSTNYLDSMNSDITAGLDAGDLVSFAITMENTGHLPAYNVEVKDDLPAGFVVPTGGLNLCVSNGAGSTLAYTGLGTTTPYLLNSGIDLTAPLGAGKDASDQTITDGTNIAVITFNLEVAGTVQPSSTITNTATLFNYSNTNGGPDFTVSDQTDQASAATLPVAVDKTLTGTELNSTYNSASQTVIGELVNYQVVVTLPEGQLPSLTVTDTLDDGLAYVKCTSITPSTGVTTDLTGGFAAACPAGSGSNPAVTNSGKTIAFSLGNITNGNRVNTVADTITIAYQAIVLNVAGNQTGTTLNNSVQVSSGATPLASDSAPDVTVIEPSPTVVKSATIAGGSIGLPGDAVIYNITISNPVGAGETDAYDVTINDNIPQVSGTDARSLIENASISSVTPALPAGTLSLTGSNAAGFKLVTNAGYEFDLPIGSSYTITIEGTLLQVVPPAVSADQLIRNTADLNWTSLDGAPGQRSTYSTDSTERTGAGGINDYTTNSNADIRVDNIVLDKTLVSPTSPFTVRIGDTVTYRVTLDVPKDVFLTGLTFHDTLQSGLAFVKCNSITASDATLTTTKGSFDCTHTPIISANPGTSLAIDFGDVNNTDITTSRRITIEYDTVVINNATNVRGHTLNNAVSASFTVNGGTRTLTDNAPIVTVIEPTLTVVKNASPTSGDAGDTITYTAVIAHSGASNATAYDAHLKDDLSALPVTLTSPAPAVVLTGASCGSPTVTDNSTGSVVEFSISALPLACTATVTYTVTLNSSVTPGETITNTAHIDWTSMDTAVASSTYNDLDCERTGDSTGCGTTANTYLTSDPATVNITAAPVKSLVSSSEAHTSGDRLVVGEIARYRLAVEWPEGTAVNVILQDSLPADMLYLDDGTAKVAFICNGGAGCMSSDTLGVTPIISGAAPAAPTDVLPDTAVSTSRTAEDDTYASGTDPYFKLGTITNNDRDVDKEYIVVEFNALVMNTSANISSHVLSDAFHLWINSTDVGSSTGISITVAEPSLSIVKTLTSSPVDAGDQANYTIVITNNSSGVNSATAFDLALSDTANSNLTINSATVTGTTQGATCTGGTAFSATPSVAGQAISLSATCLDPGSTITLTVSTHVIATAPARTTIGNSATVTYTSLPGGTGTAGGSNPTGSTTPGATGTSTGERNGSDGVGLLNDYTTNASDLGFTTAIPSFVKLAPTPTTYTIGQLVSYPLRVTVPDGTTQSLRVTDAITTGLQYVGYSVITTAAASGGLLSADYAGNALNTPTLTPASPTGNGTSATFDFGNVVFSGTEGTHTTQFLVMVQVRVMDVTGNQIGSTKPNNGSLVYLQGTGTDATINSGPVNITIAEPRIATTKSVSPSTHVQSGDVLAYTVRFTNTGTSEAYQVTADDILTQGVSYNSDAACNYYNGSTTASIPVTVTGTTTLTFGGNPAGSWDIPVTTPNSYIECTYHATAQSSLYLDGTHTNTIDADWQGLDSSSSDFGFVRTYNDTVSRTVDGTQDTATASFTSDTVSIQKVVLPTSATIGQNVTYTLTVNGPTGTIRNLRLRDVLPQGLVYNGDASATGLSGLPSMTVTSPNNGTAAVTLDWAATDVVKTAASATITFTARVADVSSNQLTSPTATTLTNTFLLDHQNAAGAAQTQLSATALETIVEPRIVTTKSVSPTIGVEAGDVLTYTVVFSNNGTSTAYDVSADDTLPQGVNFTSLTSCILSAGPVDLTAGTTVNTATAGHAIFSGAAWDIPTSENVTCVYTATAQSTVYLDGSHINTIDADWSSLDGTASNERTYVDAVSRNVDGSQDTNTASFSSDTISIAKTVNPISATIGQNVTYTLTISGPVGQVHNMQVTDILPQGLIFNNDVLISGLTGMPSMTVTGSNDGTAPVTLDWAATDVQKTAADATITFTAWVADVDSNQLNTPATSLTNTFRLNHQNAAGVAQPQLEATAPITIVEPRIATTKTVSPTAGVQAGDVVTYTVVFSNTGTSTAYEVTADDTLAQGVAFGSLTSCTLTPGSVNLTAGTTADTGTAGHVLFSGSGWTIPVGGNITCVYSADVQSGIFVNGTHTNTVDADWTSLSGSIPNERIYTDTVSRNVDGTQDTDDAQFDTSGLTFSKDVDKSTATIGETATYTLTIGGPNGTIRNLVIGDTLAAGWVYTGNVVFSGLGGSTTPTISSPNDGSVPVTLTWNLGDVAKTSANATITYTVRVANVAANASGTELGNTATLDYHLADGTPATQMTDSTTTDVVEPQMTIDKEFDTASPFAYVTPGDADSAYAGQTIAITYHVANTGTSTAYDVIVEDVLADAQYTDITEGTTPSGFTFSTSSSGGNTTVRYTATAGMAAGASADFIFNAKVASVTAGTVYNNTATVIQATTLSGSDPNERDEPDVDDTDPLTGLAPDVSVEKDDSQTLVTSSQALTYVITVRNQGANVSDATGVVVTETVPTQMTYTGSGWTCSPNVNAGSTCTYPAFDLAAGGSTTLNFGVQVVASPAAGVETLPNTVSVTDDGSHGPDQDPSNNTYTDIDTLDAASDLDISKTDGRDQVSPGMALTYTITAHNTGSQQATGVVITDTLPAEMTFVSASDSGTLSAGVVTWPAITMEAGSTVTRTLSVTVNTPLPAGLTSMTNTVTITDDGKNGTDPTLENNTYTDTDYDLADIGKVIDHTNQTFTNGQSVAVGEIITYHVSMQIAPGTLTTPAVVDNLVLEDTLDQGLAFVGCNSITPSDPAVTKVSGTYADVCSNPVVSTEPAGSTNLADAGRKVRWNIGSITNTSTSNQTLTVEYEAVVVDASEVVRGSSLGNQAHWTWDSGDLSVAAPKVTVVEPGLTIAKSADTQVLLDGGEVTYRLTIGYASDSNTDAFDVELTDLIPTGLTYEPGTLQVVSGYTDANTQVIESGAPTMTVRWPDFPSGSTAVVEYKVKVGNLPYGLTLTNTANLAWTSLPGDYIPPSSEHTVPQSPYNTLSRERYYDPNSNVDVYGTRAELKLSTPPSPKTGFAPGEVTRIDLQPAEKAYEQLDSIRMEIPALGLNLTVAGIPVSGSEWDLTWLGDQAGYLDGTAFPTHAGNSVITGHVYLPDGKPGPFVNLDQLKYGDQIIIHAYGQKYIYEVRGKQQVDPNDPSIFRHEDYPVITLLTCKGYDEQTKTYQWRYLVRAIQVKVVDE